MSKAPMKRLQNASTEEAVDAVICLKDLVSQIEAGGSPTRLVTTVGSTTFMRAVALLERIEGASARRGRSRHAI